MRIYYRDLVSGKPHWTNPKRYEIKEVNWLGTMVKAVIAYRKSDYLIIPPWALEPQSKHILSQQRGE